MRRPNPTSSRGLRLSMLAALALAAMAASPSAQACGGFVEAPVSCDDPSPNGFASWMFTRVNKALKADRAKALDGFSKGTDGFRTADTYVFCVAPDGVMSAHPNPILRGHDVRDLHDKTGNYFIKTMMESAKPDQVSVIRYLFPKPGSTVEEPKTTYFTRVDDQMCAVGIYDADSAEPAQASAEAKLSSLRRKLDGEIPASARADWNAFLEALNAQASIRDAAVARARDSLHAAEAALAPAVRPSASAD